MNQGVSILAAVLGLALFSASASADILRVVLIGGQSNADGRAPGSGLPTAPVNLQAPQPNVPFYYHTNGAAANGDGTLGILTTLRPGATEFPAGGFGPEVKLGYDLSRAFEQQPGTRLVIIKYAKGGSNLHTDWKAGGDATTTNDGNFYRTFQRVVTDGLAKLRATYPADTVTLAGMVWVQGESDITSTAANASAYGTNLTTFINDVRLTFDPALPFFLSRISNQQTNYTINNAANYATVRTRQAEVAANVTATYMIDTDGATFGMNGDNIHFNATGQQSLGAAFAARLATASTVGNWRFETSPGLLTDSGANGLTLFTQGSAPVSYPLPASGMGSSFPRTVPQTGATNATAADLGTPGSGNFARADSAALTLTNFTIEAFVHRGAATSGTQYIASQFNFTNGAQRSWGLGVAGTSPPAGLASGELFFNLSSTGTTGIVVGSGMIVPPGVDCFVAASVNASNAMSGVVFHLKDLTNGGALNSTTRANPAGTVFNSPADFMIGGFNGGGSRWAGTIDEVRLSNAVLDPYQLLVTQLGPPPVATPVISPESGSFSDPVTVAMTCATAGAEIRYTLDNSAPTAASLLYTAPFSVSVSTTLKARAFKAGTPDSEVATSTYQFQSYPVLGTLKPQHARDITNSNWSVGGETVDRDYTVFANYREWLGPLGIKRIRQQAGWFKCEKIIGVYNWAWLDECVDGALAQGLQPWLQTNYGNPIYPGGGGSGLGAGLPTSATALAAWDNWVTALVDRYKDRVNEWEVWNEPDNSGGQVTAEAYAAFYIRTATIIRARQPTARLYALAVTGPSNGPTSYVGKFFTALQTANKLHLVTAVTAHAYPWNPDSSQAGFLAMKDWVNTNFYPSGGIEVRQGESGACSEFQSEFALSNINWTELMQTKWNMRRLLGDLGHDIPSSIFAIIDMKYYGTTWNTKGLLKANEQLAVDRPKLAYFGVRNIAAVFDDSLTRITNFSHTANTASALRVFGYNKTATGKTVASIWFSGGGLPLNVNNYTDVNFTLTPADITDPVWVDMRDGTVRSIPPGAWSRSGNTCTFINVPVYDSPILIADRSAIPLASPMDKWKQVQFTVPQQGDDSISGDLADPDKDESANLLEYALGSLPMQSSSTARPLPAIDPAGQLTLTFQRTADPALLYQVLGSGNLSDWTAVWSSTGVQNIPGSVTAIDTAEVPQKRRFLKLSVTSTNP